MACLPRDSKYYHSPLTHHQWNVNMGTGAFMPGDVLNIILKAKKNGDQVNTGHVEYPLP